MGGVIYIGDRWAGKTHLALELANPQSKFVTVANQSYEQLNRLLCDEEGRAKATGSKVAIYDRNLDIKVALPIGERHLSVDWLDTSGEIWRQSWQNDNPDEWQRCLESIRASEGILLILAPYREALKSCSEQDAAEYITRQQWTKRFERWVKFFKYDCPNARHIVVCLNKADLLDGCDISRESVRLAFDPYYSKLTWHQRHSHVCNQYLQPIQAHLEEINRNRSGVSVYCAITTIKDRNLLELPWVYLATYLTV